MYTALLGTIHTRRFCRPHPPGGPVSRTDPISTERETDTVAKTPPYGARPPHVGQAPGAVATQPPGVEGSPRGEENIGAERWKHGRVKQ